MKSYTLAVFFVLFLSQALAQNTGKVFGTLSQTENSAEGATAALLRGKDSSVVKLAAVSKNGSFSFENIADGTYLVSITKVGFKKFGTARFELKPEQRIIQLPAITLVPVAKVMSDVTVTARRSLVEEKIDRTIVNVDASITNVGTSALEVLEKSPGVSVDRDGNISLKGKEGVLIMVDGRPTHLSGPDLANLLRNMSSNQLDQIEIMTNPPAKYDAAGTSGIINIKTKKNITAGYNGTATATLTQGRYTKTNEGFNFNYRENKVNLFTNLSHNYRKGFGILRIQRNIYDPNTSELENYFNQRAYMLNTGNSYNAKVGADYFVSKATTLGIVLNGSSSPTSSSNMNRTDISNSLKDLESITDASVNNDIRWKSFSTNLNMRSQLDKKGREITADLDFLDYGFTADQFMVNSYRDGFGNASRKADSLMGELPQDIKVYSGRVDYLQPLKKGARFEAGLKTGLVRTDNNASYDSIQYGAIVHDFNRSNHFVYEENINAAYVNMSGPLSKKWSGQLGLRLENTNAKGTQLTTGQVFNRHYTQLFPTAYLQYKANDKNNWRASFSRRIRRPNYQSLNPFIQFIDRYTYTQGNPSLKPALSNNIELSHSWKNYITTTLNYSATNNLIDDVIEQKGQEAYKAPANIASLYQLGLAISVNAPLNKWWTTSINVNAFNNHYKGIAGGTAVDFSQPALLINSTQQFKLTKTLTGEINGRWLSGRLEGIMKAKSVGFVGAGLSQQVMKGAGTLRLTIRDIFYTQKFSADSRYGNVDFNFQQTGDTRVVALGFSYRFSKGKKIAPVKRTAGSAGEEQERIGL